MSDRMTISASERGQIRVFALNMDPGEARVLAEPPDEPDDWPLLQNLGAERLDPEWVDLVIPKDLGEMTLSDFLIEGPGAAREAVAGDAARLDALTDPVLILPSQAFAGTGQTIDPHAPLRWIGTYAEASAAPPGPPLQSASAEGHLGTRGTPGTSRPMLKVASFVVAGIIILGVIFLGAMLMGGRP